MWLALQVPTQALQAADDGRDPIVVQDPHYGEVLFYFYQEDYFPAIVRLLAAKDKQQLDDHSDEAELLLGGMYLSYGHHLEAADIFERLLADNVAPDIRDRTWFFLAKIWYQRGYLDKSRQALSYIERELPKNLQREALMLESQILIDAGDYDAAIARLQNWKGKTEWARYARFNLGVALVRLGRVDEAARLLDDLGDLDPYNNELASLRDKANLALGYALLQDGQPSAAKAPLQRVRLEGPFSNKALLGVGWADAEIENYQRALVPWMELRSRNLLDSAVQESMLAIPYAMAKLDSISQAADHYLNAIEAFYEETNRLDRTIQHIESGLFFDDFVEDDPLDSAGWYWRLEELPAGLEARYLFHLLATHKFQEGLKNYRDLSYLYRNLDEWQLNVGVYGNMLETRKEAYALRLPRVEDALARADLDGMVSRKLEFDSTLNNIEESHDWLALATQAEFDMWGEITGLENTPALRADIPEAEEVRDKIRLLKGVLQWNLERDFGDRLWRIRRNLRQSGEALVATQRSRRQIDETMRLEPLRFAELSNRVYGLAPRIEGTKMRVEDALSRQRAFLQSIAVGELQAQKQRLDIYTVQARFALAAIYDIAATVGDASE
ncbi:MAG: tetratricopeptide repeat protein [Gammaproteobacteria bacterium]|nr:tetratricopeptide repeat protein [Gammaproteobacteria bacterium]MBT8111895.1 tetratricopeptide repeat protein [Gammaproteobacteria bacterium]NND46779.1 tetratricopeptide repeat protein [Woeseiaceae bacterium]NNL46594.1 tetratricopeptide repeat protein [Woeseiaceae bacterium]